MHNPPASEEPGHIYPQRRALLKSTVAAAAATMTAAGASLLTPRVASAQVTQTVVPPATTPFVERLPAYGPLAYRSNLDPAPGEFAVAGECGRGPHQLWQANSSNLRLYELVVQPATHYFHRDLQPAAIWGYNGITPGPTICARYGEPVVLRIRNRLPPDHQGFGSPEISTHLHNGHVSWESDGFPQYWYSGTKYGRVLTAAGEFLDHHYPNIYAGGDPREAQGTLWYHDHTEHFTAANIYRGLAGFYLLFDELDSGNERDTNASALRLPSGVGRYDIPLMFQDKFFDASGALYFNQLDTEGLVGNKVMVNGKIQPYLDVERRKYRFRMLNASLLQFYEFFLVANNRNQSFSYIANDGNLLPQALTMTSVRLSPAERADIVIDFSRYPIGTELYVVNRLEQDDGRGPDGKLMRGGGQQFMRFVVASEPGEQDMSEVPTNLRPMPKIDLSAVVRRRKFKFDRQRGQWTINGKTENSRLERAYFQVRLGDPEIWEFETSGGWAHPVHFHLEEGIMISRNGKTPPPHERGRKDVFSLLRGDRVEVYVNFRDFTGSYVMHCHNAVHEDHEMMVRFDVVAPGQTS